jgi:hypothetical protein
MRVLVACEYTGTVKRAFWAAGFEDTYSCDLRPCLITPEKHFQCNVETILDQGWDLLIAHPPCTYLAWSSAPQINRDPSRIEKRHLAGNFAHRLYYSQVPYIAIENPKGWLRDYIGKPHTRCQPWQFGDAASKETWLWHSMLPPLMPTVIRDLTYAPYWQTIHAKKTSRDITFPGIARAMADQWGNYVKNQLALESA